jgi:hypothetical protein
MIGLYIENALKWIKVKIAGNSENILSLAIRQPKNLVRYSKRGNKKI